jgi:hypothetical protein
MRCGDIISVTGYVTPKLQCLEEGTDAFIKTDPVAQPR